MGRYKKNVKRVDPRYFMDEKVDAPLYEAAGGADPPRFSPLSATTPGERIPVPGSQRPLEKRGLGEELKYMRLAVELIDEKYKEMMEINYKDGQAPPEVWHVGSAIQQARLAAESLQDRIGEDPRAPRLEEG